MRKFVHGALGWVRCCHAGACLLRSAAGWRLARHARARGAPRAPAAPQAADGRRRGLQFRDARPASRRVVSTLARGVLKVTKCRSRRVRSRRSRCVPAGKGVASARSRECT
jgi:hypothetical protein